MLKTKGARWLFPRLYNTTRHDIIVVSNKAHQYKLSLRRQVLYIGGTKNRAQQYKLAQGQRAIKFNTCSGNVNETYQDANTRTQQIYNIVMIHNNIICF